MEYYIKHLHLQQIDLGGYFGEGQHRSDLVVSPHAALPPRFHTVDEKRIYSMNYYLLPQSDVLRLHRLAQDELWFFHAGSALRLHMFDTEQRRYKSVVVGPRIDCGQFLQFSVPHGVLFGAEVLREDDTVGAFSVCSCVLSPAWDLPDSSTPTAEELASLVEIFSEQSVLLTKLSGQR